MLTSNIDRRLRLAATVPPGRAPVWRLLPLGKATGGGRVPVRFCKRVNSESSEALRYRKIQCKIDSSNSSTYYLSGTCMSLQITEFLVALPNQKVQSLSEAIRQVLNLSAGFCKSWTKGDYPDARSTSAEAFDCLDTIIGHLLRIRDERKNSPGWNDTDYKKALDQVVGKLLKPAIGGHRTAFLELQQGNGIIPSTDGLIDLTLEVALNKLKHHYSVNFAVTPSSQHILYVLTDAGIGQPHTISRFDVEDFCGACKEASRFI